MLVPEPTYFFYTFTKTRFMKKNLLLLLLSAFFYQLNAQISSRQIDSIAEKSLKTFDVPGMAVAVVKDGKIIHIKGYGVASLNTGEKINEHTRFAIASNSKAFTSAALGMLIDEGKIKWTTLVTDIIPEFKLYNPYVTENFMIADLLCHRSGLGLGAGDLMFWPGIPEFTKNDIIHNLRFLKPVSPFRTKYDYDNLLYMVAGEVVGRVSGMSWEDFVEENIFKPLGMDESATSWQRLKNKANVIDAHAPVNGKVQVVNREMNEVLNAAGGIYSSVSDMSKWAIMQMDNGLYGNNLSKRLFSDEVHTDMWTIHTVIPIKGISSYKSQFRGYGLGWNLIDEMGHMVASHTGGLLGMVTQVTLIPDMKLGIIVFTNQQSGAAFLSVTNSIKDAYYGIKKQDRIKQQYESVVAGEKRAKEITDKVWRDIQSVTAKPANLEKFVGTYKDEWFGKVTISKKGNDLYFTSEKSPDLHGPMSFYKESTFVIKWEDRSLDADAFINFGFDFSGKPVSATMKAISPLTDFSFDFQDLNFSRMK